MFYYIKDFLADYKYEVSATLKILNAMNDETLYKRIDGYGRSAGNLAWHITTGIGEMMARTGLKVTALDENASPDTVKEIVDAYEKASKELSEAVENTWKDEDLLKENDMYGETYKNGVTLEILIRHEVHHRAQMTVLLRLLGLPVPGIYGPSKEEWVAFKMPAPVERL
jgi:uncharacterized damage-inducible protein DinB